MKKNKIILKHCPNFYSIINFEFDEEDVMTNKIISIYQDYIFNVDQNNENDLNKIERLDYILKKYIDDYSFRSDMQKGLLQIRISKKTDIISYIVDTLLNLFEKYEDGLTRNIYFARWI